MRSVEEKVREALGAGLIESDLAYMLKLISDEYYMNHSVLICQACETKCIHLNLTDGDKCPNCGHDEFYADIDL